MLCSYPNCRKAPTKVPVIALPTYRTVGLHKPHLDADLVTDRAFMAKMGLDRGRVIRQHEQMVREYQENSGNIIKTDKPTYLIGVGLCDGHAASYKFTDWFEAKEWRLLQEAGRQKGVYVPEPHLLVIHWRPVGWEPSQGYLEVER